MKPGEGVELPSLPPLAERIQHAKDAAVIVGQAARIFRQQLTGMSGIEARKALGEFVYAYTIATCSPYLIDAGALGHEIMSRFDRRGRNR